MSMTKGTPASSQIITLTRLLEECGDERDRLAAELEELRQRFDKLNHECDGYMEDNKRLDAENKRLWVIIETIADEDIAEDGLLRSIARAALKEKS